jgi:hypothetical protein
MGMKMGHTPVGSECLEVGVKTGAAAEPEERKLTGVRPEDDECCPSTRRPVLSAEVSTRGKLVISAAPDTRWLLTLAGYKRYELLLKRERSYRVQVVYERCCGLDVHKRTVVARVLLSQADGTVEREARTLGP